MNGAACEAAWLVQLRPAGNSVAPPTSERAPPLIGQDGTEERKEPIREQLAETVVEAMAPPEACDLLTLRCAQSVCSSCCVISGARVQSSARTSCRQPGLAQTPPSSGVSGPSFCSTHQTPGAARSVAHAAPSPLCGGWGGCHGNILVLKLFAEKVQGFAAGVTWRHAWR